MAGGRPKGTLGSKTLEAITILTKKGCDPMGILADIAMGSKIKCGISTLEGTIEGEMIPTMDQRKDAAKELCQYIYPKRKAVEHTGDIDHGITVQIVRYGDAKPNKDNVDIYKEGFQAFRDGQTAKHNPYSRLSDKYFAWLRGWSTAKFGSGMK